MNPILIHTCQKSVSEVHDSNAHVPVIFLAGPTLRNPTEERSWRAAAIEHFDDFEYKGLLIVPEFRDHKRPAHIHDSPEGNAKIYAWEWEWLVRADVILFWVPRHMTLLPGLTTNIEFGMYVESRKIVFGAPPEAEHVEYMRYHCTRNKIPQADKLSTTVHLSLVQLALVKEGGKERT